MFLLGLSVLPVDTGERVGGQRKEPAGRLVPLVRSLSGDVRPRRRRPPRAGVGPGRAHAAQAGSCARAPDHRAAATPEQLVWSLLDTASCLAAACLGSYICTRCRQAHTSRSIVCRSSSNARSSLVSNGKCRCVAAILLLANH